MQPRSEASPRVRVYVLMSCARKRGLIAVFKRYTSGHIYATNHLPSQSRCTSDHASAVSGWKITRKIISRPGLHISPTQHHLIGTYTEVQTCFPPLPSLHVRNAAELVTFPAPDRPLASACIAASSRRARRPRFSRGTVDGWSQNSLNDMHPKAGIQIRR
jgi:hypothetical protein